MGAHRCGPIAHGLMAQHRGGLTGVNDESGRPMREQTDVIERPSDERAIIGHQPTVRLASHRRDENKNEAFGRARFEKLEASFGDEISQEEAG